MVQDNKTLMSDTIIMYDDDWWQQVVDLEE